MKTLHRQSGALQRGKFWKRKGIRNVERHICPLSSPWLTLLVILFQKLAINGYMEVFSYWKKKNNKDFVIVFKIMSGNRSDISGPYDLDLWTSDQLEMCP
jgi:hypothetical protein